MYVDHLCVQINVYSYSPFGSFWKDYALFFLLLVALVRNSTAKKKQNQKKKKKLETICE